MPARSSSRSANCRYIERRLGSAAVLRSFLITLVIPYEVSLVFWKQRRTTSRTRKRRRSFGSDDFALLMMSCTQFRLHLMHCKRRLWIHGTWQRVNINATGGSTGVSHRRVSRVSDSCGREVRRAWYYTYERSTTHQLVRAGARALIREHGEVRKSLTRGDRC